MYLQSVSINSWQSIFNSYIYVVGGADDGSQLSMVERLDTTAETPEWETIASLNTPRYCPAIAADAAGRIYVIGGGSGPQLGTVEIYDPMRDDLGWTIMEQELVVPRVTAGIATLDDGRFLLFGGQGEGGAHLDTVEVFNPARPDDGWTLYGTLGAGPNSNIDLGTMGADGRFYIVGGWGPGFLDRAVRYDPQEDYWDEIPSLPDALDNEPMVLGVDGNIYVIGGETSVWVYTANVWKFPTDYCNADLNGDCLVDVLDLLDILAAWGACP